MRLCTFLAKKILKKGIQIGPKLKRELSTQEGHLTLLECRSAHGKFQLAQIFGPARGPPDCDKAYLFQLFRDKDTFQFISDLIQLIF